MNSFMVTLWAEYLKVRRTKVLWISVLFFAFVASMMGLVIFLQLHPALADKLGLIGAKANMLRFGDPTWSNYLVLVIQGIAGVGLIGFGFITSWVFGREYSDHTIKDLLALPVSRASIVVSKVVLIFIWSILLSAVFLTTALLVGKLSGLPRGAGEVFATFLQRFVMVSVCSMLLCTPIAFLTSCSEGLLLPFGSLVLILIVSNVTGLLGIAHYFPWAVPSLWCVPFGTAVSIGFTSYTILFTTVVLGLAGTLGWWRWADQSSR